MESSGQFKKHGLILAGMQSSSGKTALTCMLLAALRQRGVPLQPFKVGPDFIDPGYHNHYTPRPSVNLDSWMMGQSGVLESVKTHGAGNLSIVEGVMGLFDGASPSTDEGSTLELAQWLDWPIVLVVPCQKVGRSIGAAIRGFVEQAGRQRIAGLILNQIGSTGHELYLKEALADLKLPIVGAIPSNPLLDWQERHLGLQASSEKALPSVEELAKLGESVLDLSLLQSWLSPAPPQELEVQDEAQNIYRIGVARDEAFHFYYHANLEYLRAQGATLVEFSPLQGQVLPSDLDGVVFGGGFPEVFGEQLADNQSMRRSIAQAVDSGMPCYAECGGLMLLSEELKTVSGQAYPMAGVLPGTVQMTPRLQNFGYCWASTSAAEPSWKGHEFHYSQWHGEANHANLWTVSKKNRKTSRKEGYGNQNLHASYVHLHFPSSAPVLNSLLSKK